MTCTAMPSTLTLYPCGYCDRPFISPETLAQHVEGSHWCWPTLLTATTGPHCVIDDARDASQARAGSAGSCATTTWRRTTSPQAKASVTSRQVVHLVHNIDRSLVGRRPAPPPSGGITTPTSSSRRGCDEKIL